MSAALLVCAATVLAASAPGTALAVRDLSHDQDRSAAARLGARATVLAHELADERDDLALFVAAGRSAAGGAGLPESDRAQVDRQAGDVAAAAPAALRTALAGLPDIRQNALTGKGGPQTVVTAYQPLIDALGRVSGPGPVGAPLARAVGAAAAERGLLVAALTAGGGQQTLVAAAQTARVQERAALAEFRATASAGLRLQYDSAVTGPVVTRADRDLAVLLDRPELDDADRALDAGRVQAALTARIVLMRGVDVSSATERAHSAAADRGHDVTVLLLRAALTVLCLLLLVGVLVTLFRSLSRPLAALYRWSRADPASGQGVEVTGADEFAAVARRADALTHEAQELRSRAAELTGERTTSLGVQSALAAERDVLLRTRDELSARLAALDRQLGAANAQSSAHLTYVNLSLRTLGLVERQLTLIESLEDHEQDPVRLETLFRLDHLATRMRRNSENLLVLTGTEHSHGPAARPVPLVDVARAAISETDGYERVRIQQLPAARVAGRAADDISHLLAELLDNAAAFSGEQTEVHLSGWLVEGGEVMLSVEDGGTGLPAERLDELNALLADPEPLPPGPVSGTGLYVVARLAHRHGVQVRLRSQTSGGTAAVVVLPSLLLPAVRADEPPATPVEAALAGMTPGSGMAVTGAPVGPDELVGPGESEEPPGWGPGSRPGPVAAPGPAAWAVPAAPPVPAAWAVPAAPVAPAVPVPPVAVAAVPVPAAAVPPVPVPAAVPVPAEGLTAKGLPQRVPRAARAEGADGEPAVRGRGRGRGNPVDAEELRRKLGGLQRGQQAGRRDAEIESSTGAVPVAVPVAVPDAVPFAGVPAQQSQDRTEDRTDGREQGRRRSRAEGRGTHRRQEAQGPHSAQDPQDTRGAAEPADSVEEANR